MFVFKHRNILKAGFNPFSTSIISSFYFWLLNPHHKFWFPTAKCHYFCQHTLFYFLQPRPILYNSSHVGAFFAAQLFYNYCLSVHTSVHYLYLREIRYWLFIVRFKKSEIWKTGRIICNNCKILSFLIFVYKIVAILLLLRYVRTYFKRNTRKQKSLCPITKNKKGWVISRIF